MTVPALVQHTSTQGSAVTSLTVTLPAVAAGDMLWAGISFGPSSSLTALTSVDDSAGTFSEVIIGPGSSNGENGQWVEYDAVAGTHTVTANFSAGANAGLFAAEFSGVATSAALDGTPQQKNSSGTPITCPTVTPSQTGDLWIAMVASGPGGVTYTNWLNGLTPVDLENGPNSSGTWAWTVWNSTSAAEAGCTPSVTNPWSISSALFKAASGGSTITGSASITEGADTASATGTLGISGSGAATEGADASAATGTLSVSGAASATEAPDTASATGTTGSSVSGSGATTEGADAASGVGSASVSGSASASEDHDAASGAGTVSVSGTGAAAESADTGTATGTLAATGSAAATESADVATGSGSATGVVGTPGSIPSVARYTIRRQVARNFTVWRSFPRNFTVRRSLVRVFEVNSVSIRFPVKGPAEATPLTFDFSADLPSGVTLSGAPTMSIACTEGTDANAANVISGSVALNAGKTAVVQDGTGGLDGCEYTITCTCATTQSNLTLTLVGILAVRANLN